MIELTDDHLLLEIFLIPLRKCARYKPAFGQAERNGLSLLEFQQLYSQDIFYSWIGLNDPNIYAAHKAAGGLTSVYRQLGVGCERLFQTVLMRNLNLNYEQINWQFLYAKPDGSSGVHTLDARITVEDLEGVVSTRFAEWIQVAHASVRFGTNAISPLRGVVFEVRQGYKSADSKRQNADLRFGMHAYQEALLPAFALMSSQISEPVARRYRSDGMLVLIGTASSDPTKSTFAFLREIVGYDLAGFFERNSEVIQSEVKTVVIKLLSPEA